MTPEGIYKKGKIEIVRLNGDEEEGYDAFERLRLRSDIEHFPPVPRDDFQSGREIIYLLRVEGRPVGYRVWSRRGDPPVSRQLFVLPGYRGRGLGTLLVQKTTESEVGNGVFAAENPNKKTLGIFVKLGYATRNKENGVVYGSKVMFL